LVWVCVMVLWALFRPVGGSLMSGWGWGGVCAAVGAQSRTPVPRCSVRGVVVGRCSAAGKWGLFPGCERSPGLCRLGVVILLSSLYWDLGIVAYGRRGRRGMVANGAFR